jgi:diketogulonate reductase-like aldo/keto reductase
MQGFMRLELMRSTLAQSDQPVAGVDPKLVPFRTLSSAARMPSIGLGTFGSDHVSHDAVAEAVKYAASIGNRHFDCASVYGNEEQIGGAFRAMFQNGLRRNEVWITSKLWNDKHGENDVIPSCEKSLSDLQAGYLDLYLVHWPFPNHHPPGCDVSARYAHAVPYIHENFMRTWRRMEELADRGLVRHIGTSNMTIPKMELLLRDARIKPVANEMELHPHFQQPGFFRYLLDKGIQPIGYSPIGSPGRPGRDRTPEDTSPVEDPGDSRNCTKARGAPRGRVHKVGDPAWTDSNSVLGESAKHTQQPSWCHRQTVSSGGHGGYCKTGSQLPVDQGAGISLEG